MANNYLNPTELGPTNGWTHVTVASPGTLVYVSGQVSVDATGAVVGKGDLRVQATRAFDNVAIALKAAGVTFGDVVMSRIFVVGLKPELVPIIREVRAKYFLKDTPPASTLVGVERLVGPDWLIEIEVTAVK